MHAEAYGFVATWSRECEARRVLDLGGRNVNGSPRGLFPGAEYTVLDQLAAPEVQIVADAATWRPAEDQSPWDVVVCCEVLEHAPRWREILKSAYVAAAPAGWLVLTAAGPARAPHSGFDGAGLRQDEPYANIWPEELREGLTDAGWLPRLVVVERDGQDIYAVARREA